MVPQIIHHPLARADGSATFTDRLFSILGSANGPVEVQRRDELPDEAAIEVNIRPLSGVGGPRERWLEGVLHAVLRSVLLVHLHPRTLIQVTLQIAKQPEAAFSKGKTDVALLPSLLNAAFFALLDAGLPLATTGTAVLLAVGGKKCVCDPTESDLAHCRSVHAMAYDLQGALLLDESVGSFGLDTWEEVAALAKETCMDAMGAAEVAEDEAMGEEDTAAAPWLRRALEEKVKDASAWREAT